MGMVNCHVRMKLCPVVMVKCHLWTLKCILVAVMSLKGPINCPWGQNTGPTYQVKSLIRTKNRCDGHNFVQAFYSRILHFAAAFLYSQSHRSENCCGSSQLYLLWFWGGTNTTDNLINELEWMKVEELKNFPHKKYKYFSWTFLVRVTAFVYPTVYHIYVWGHPFKFLTLWDWK